MAVLVGSPCSKPVSLAGPETGFLGFSPSTPHHNSVVIPPMGAKPAMEADSFPTARLLDAITWRTPPKSPK